MGGVSIPGAGGKRAVDVEINLVPFIDMMSCLLAFLMLTAVWNRLAKIDIDQVLPKSQAQPQPQEPKKDDTIQLLIDGNAFVVNVKHGDDDDPPKVLRRGNDGKLPVKELERVLKEMQEALPKDKDNNLHSRIMLVGRDKVHYEDVVAAMDVCIGLKLTGIQLGTDETVPTLVAALEGRS